MPPVPGYQLIAAVWIGSGDGRDQYTVLLDAVGSFHHGLIILDFEGMILERV